MKKELTGLKGELMSINKGGSGGTNKALRR